MFDKHRPDGQALILVALAMVVLLGAAALAVDAGHLYSVRRQMQNAADAGALAGARDICDGSPATAISTANTYKVANGARSSVADISVVDNTIVVVNAVTTTNTYLAGTFGRLLGNGGAFDSVDVSAVAAGACGRAVVGCGIWPVAFRQQLWDDVPCDTEFLVWDDKNCSDPKDPANPKPNEMTCGFYVWDTALQRWIVDPLLCTCCECDDLAFGAPKIGPGDRGWLTFSPTNSPLDPECVTGNCGANDLECYVKYDWAGRVAVGECLPGEPGVDVPALDAVHTREGESLWVPLWDQEGGCSAVVGTCPGTHYRVSGFGCIYIPPGAYDSKFTMPKKPGAPPSYSCPKNEKVIRVIKKCDCPPMGCGSTEGDENPVDLVEAVSLVPVPPGFE